MNEKVDFLIVGTQKGGTTALDKYLREHDELLMAKRKEVHFFDEEKHFKIKPDYEIYHSFFEAKERQTQLWGECTPIYMYWQDSIKRVYEYNPNIKIIVVLRNPIDRAYSHWNMERDRGAELLSFSEALRSEQKRCRGALPLQHRVFSYIDRGFYTEQLRRIWRYFPVEQTLVIKNEDLKNNPNSVLSEVARLLGVKPFFPVKHKNVHSREYITTMAEIDKEYLVNIFELEIKRLERVLGWDCADWLK